MLDKKITEKCHHSILLKIFRKFSMQIFPELIKSIFSFEPVYIEKKKITNFVWYLKRKLNMFGIVSDSMISKNGRWKHFRKYVAFDSVSNMLHRKCFHIFFLFFTFPCITGSHGDFICRHLQRASEVCKRNLL